MRRFLVPILVVLLAAAIESALLPPLFRGAWRPGLTLVVASIWAHLTDIDGAIAVFAGGIALEAISGLPFGVIVFALMLGNGIAALVDRAPLPSAFFRATNWVAVTTLVYHLAIIGIQTLRGVEIDLATATTTVLIPLLLFNPLLSIPAFFGVRALIPRLRRVTRLR
ncbi:MAG: hypothetical protein ABIQ99_00750 [Thermoflexales bacterium]